ncbi:GNAT family N-acetyltransferase [Litoribaculum gwangyangense]|uniref:GNAT family N-acetyltransferase n=1 Tax=Litoribaculum gwangyangense TaxID=1130722 RepID=A0ABP9CPR7_9FLAO
MLRAGKPIETCVFDGDDLETTFHLGIHTKDKLVGICSFFKKDHTDIQGKNQYQLRGMAVLKEYQGLGLGNIILTYGEKILEEKKVEVIWCNAREVALNFYKKCGYQIIGNSFLIQDIGWHYVMFKFIND